MTRKNEWGLRFLFLVALLQIAFGVWSGDRLFQLRLQGRATTATVGAAFPCTNGKAPAVCVPIHFPLESPAGEVRSTTVIARAKNSQALARYSAGGSLVVRYDPNQPMHWEPVDAQSLKRQIIWGAFMIYATVLLAIVLAARRRARREVQ